MNEKKETAVEKSAEATKASVLLKEMDGHTYLGISIAESYDERPYSNQWMGLGSTDALIVFVALLLRQPLIFSSMQFLELSIHENFFDADII